MSVSGRSAQVSHRSVRSETRSPHVHSVDTLEGDSLSRLVPEKPPSVRGSLPPTVRTAPSVASLRSQPKVPTNFNLTKFLADLGLADYEDLLRETGFDDYRSILAIEEEDMDAIGMITGHKRKLLRAVADLNDGAREAGSVMSDSRAPKSPDKFRAGGDVLDLRREQGP